MEEFDELDTYNGHPEHDMWVDFTTYEYTGELGEYFDESDTNDFKKLNE